MEKEPEFVLALDISKGIYKIVNNINKKVYIGSAGGKHGFKKRWSYHIQDLIKNKHHSKHLQRAWNKYGKNSFSFEIIEIVNNEEINTLLEREQYYIDYYESYDVNKGYNICKIAGSSLGVKKTDEEKLRQSELRKGKPIPWLNTGEPRSKEHIENLRSACIGKISEKLDKTYEEIYGEEKANELKKRLSEVHIGLNAGDKHPMYGSNHKEETKKKISEKLSKPVLQKNLDGVLICEYKSVRDVENKTGIPYYKIKYYCTNKNNEYDGFKWEYK